MIYIVKGEFIMQQVLNNEQQDYILQALGMGLQAIKEYSGEERTEYYNNKLLKTLHATDELEFLKSLEEILEEIEGELNEYVR